MSCAIIGFYSDWNTFTRERLIPGVQDGILSQLGTTGKIFKSRATIETGAAGAAVAFTADLVTAEGGHYKGNSDAKSRGKANGSVQYRADYFNIFGDAVLAGTELHANSGVTTDQIMTGQGRIKDLAENKQIQLERIGVRALKRGTHTIANYFETDLWGIERSDDPGPEFMQDALPELFNESGSWLSQSPSSFGVWEEGHKWAVNPPNSLTGNQRFYRNIPQVFGAGSDRALDIDLIDEAALVMQDVVEGIWAMPATPKRMSKLAAQIRKRGDGEQNFVRMGFDGYRLGVRAIRIQNVIIYPDSRAKLAEDKKEMWAAHIGDEDANPEASMDAGFCVGFWMPEEISEQLTEIQENMYSPENMKPVGTNPLLVGVDAVLPMWNFAWDRDSSKADSIYTRAFAQAVIYGQRWKNFKIANVTDPDPSA